MIAYFLNHFSAKEIYLYLPPSLSLSPPVLSITFALRLDRGITIMQSLLHQDYNLEDCRLVKGGKDSNTWKAQKLMMSSISL